MNIDEMTANWLAKSVDEPLPEEHERKFGLTGVFKKYDSLEAMEAAHMECIGKETVPFGYSDYEYPKKKENFKPDDEFWLINNVIYVIRNGSVMLTEYRAGFETATVKTFIQPDPNFFIDLNVI